jgi:hypothetical protein
VKRVQGGEHGFRSVTLPLGQGTEYSVRIC